MFISHLTLQFFRNYDSGSFDFSQPTTVIVGPNAKGKTSIVEAIYLLATGNSFRAEKVDEMIQFNQELARVSGVITEGLIEAEEITTLEIMLTRGLVQGKKTQLRLYSVNDIRRRKKEFVSHFAAVVFRPEDMRLIEGSPSRRRGFLNAPLQVLDAEYDHALSTYDQALLRRNRLLEQVREREQSENALMYWNLTLIKYGEYLQQQRQKCIDFMNTIAFPVSFVATYKPSLISAERIAEYQSREIAAGHTLVGPHKDDFEVSLRTTDPAQPPELAIAQYGSRGQQRLAVLWLKSAELAYVKKNTQQPPVLLLDDILSELDSDNQHLIIELFGQQQTIVTTIDPEKAVELKDQSPELEIITL